MFNPYIIVLALFALAGVIVTTWGWAIIARSRKTRRWPSVIGLIEESKPASDADDLLPHIVFRYTVNGHVYCQSMEFPRGISPSKQLTANYVEKFPAGAEVPVYYDPGRPDNATLEPGVGSDWMIFALGLSATLFTIIALFFGG